MARHYASTGNDRQVTCDANPPPLALQSRV